MIFHFSDPPSTMQHNQSGPLPSTAGRSLCGHQAAPAPGPPPQSSSPSSTLSSLSTGPTRRPPSPARRRLRRGYRQPSCDLSRNLPLQRFRRAWKAAYFRATALVPYSASSSDAIFAYYGLFVCNPVHTQEIFSQNPLGLFARERRARRRRR